MATGERFTKTVDIKAVDEDERTATGAVLVPDELDHQHDYLRPDAVERFHADDPNTGVMHAAFPDNAADLERSEVITEAEAIGDETFPPGTWVATRRYEDDDLWQLVADGILQGFSIGGEIQRAVDVEALPDDVRVPDAVEHDGGGGTELLDGSVDEVSDVDIPAVPRATYKGRALGKSLLDEVDGEAEFVELMVEQRGHEESAARRLYQYLTDVRGKAATVAKQFSADVFRLVAGDDNEMFDSGEVLGIGVDFPNHDVHVDWNVDAWPDDQQLAGPHVSVYDSIDDAKQVAQGDIEVIETVDAESDVRDKGIRRKDLLEKPFTAPNGTEFEDWDDCIETVEDWDNISDPEEACGAWQAETKVDVNGTEVDLTPPVSMINAAQAAAEAGSEGRIPDSCGTGTGDRRRQQILDGELSADVVREVAAYLVSHEEDVTADGSPGEWSDEEWADCGNAQYAKWGGTGGGEPMEWAMARVNEIDRARDEDLTYPEIENAMTDDTPTDEPTDATKWQILKELVLGSDDADAAEAPGAAKASDGDDEDDEDDEEEEMAANKDAPAGDTAASDMTEDTSKSDLHERVDALAETVESISEKLDDDGGDDAEKSLEEKIDDLAKTVDDLGERVDTIATQSGHSQQLGGAEKNGSDPDDEVEAFKAQLVGGRTGGDD